jgi:hypothetical protein
MFTITGIHHLHEESEDLQRLEANFRELRKKLKRKYPEFRYFAVKELSPDGNWHYHGIWNIYIAFEELVEMWKEISGAHRVYLKKVYSVKSSINYIFKYCFKSIHNPRELEQLYETDKRKFSCSKGLLSKDKSVNPYTTEYGVDYSTEELKVELYTIVHNSALSVDDFSSTEYPYFEDLIMNLFYKLTDEHPPPQHFYDEPKFFFLT